MPINGLKPSVFYDWRDSGGSVIPVQPIVTPENMQAADSYARLSTDEILQDPALLKKMGHGHVLISQAEATQASIQQSEEALKELMPEDMFEPIISTER